MFHGYMGYDLLQFYWQVLDLYLARYVLVEDGIYWSLGTVIVLDSRKVIYWKSKE